MRMFSLLALLAAIGAALLGTMVAPVVRAQAEPTPIFSEPVLVTPLVTTEPADRTPVEAPVAPGTTAPAAPTERAEQRAAVADACESNDTPVKACPLPLDAVSGPFTFVPDSDQDFFRLELPQEPSIQTLITVRATAGLGLIVSARQNDAVIATGTMSLTLSPAITGTVVLRVENRDPRPAAGEQYRVELRRQIVPPSTTAPEGTSLPTPDALENNWSFDFASAVAPGVVYDLNVVCPDPRPDACSGGDHDYLVVPVKAGVAYLFATFDLDPGVDTVLELFWGSTATAIAGNDDYGPGGALSAMRWTAPSDGLLGIRIAPRNGGLAQHVADSKDGYRFAVAPLASELARKLSDTIDQQAAIPTPTPAPVAGAPAAAPASALSSASAPAAAPVAGGAGSGSGASVAPVQETIAAGPAIIVKETVLRREPRENATALTTLATETRVSVRGAVSGLWVSVETDASIIPGWVLWSDLKRLNEGDQETTSATTAGGATNQGQSQQSGAAVAPGPTIVAGANATSAGGLGATTSSAPSVRITALDLALPPAPAAPAARVPFTVAVTVAATNSPPTGRSSLGIPTPTPDLSNPLKDVRVQLVNVFGDVLAEGLTSDQGVVSLTRDVRSNDALLIRMPAWGVELPLAADQASLVVSVPEDAQ
jgi:hypothetical protein